MGYRQAISDDHTTEPDGQPNQEVVGHGQHSKKIFDSPRCPQKVSKTLIVHKLIDTVIIY
jgi:hypothetical protein